MPKHEPQTADECLALAIANEQTAKEMKQRGDTAAYRVFLNIAQSYIEEGIELEQREIDKTVRV